jgi:hypothetical protein
MSLVWPRQGYSTTRRPRSTTRCCPSDCEERSARLCDECARGECDIAHCLLEGWRLSPHTLQLDQNCTHLSHHSSTCVPELVDVSGGQCSCLLLMGHGFWCLPSPNNNTSQNRDIDNERRRGIESPCISQPMSEASVSRFHTVYMRWHGYACHRTTAVDSDLKPGQKKLLHHAPRESEPNLVDIFSVSQECRVRSETDKGTAGHSHLICMQAWLVVDQDLGRTFWTTPRVTCAKVKMAKNHNVYPK